MWVVCDECGKPIKLTMATMPDLLDEVLCGVCQFKKTRKEGEGLTNDTDM